MQKEEAVQIDLENPKDHINIPPLSLNGLEISA